jgi:DNA-binding transcriptional LysR family regulator
VSESIAIGLKRVAIILAEDLDYSLAAKKLGLTSVELRKQISALEAQLYFHIFKPRQEKVELTEEGQFLIEVFRKSVALHDRNDSKGPGDVH